MEVTARKYRPQKFIEFVGQEHIISSLQNALKDKRYSHAYLFSGPRGIGKTSCARVLAKALNCIQFGPSEEPCGVCENCTEISIGNCVDVIEIDGASNRGIDQIRELRDNTQFLPSKSNYKIYIIDEVHMLTDPAFNALLKTLEEPPPHVLFIFATTEPHKVKITIRSRCQHYHFKRLSLTHIFKQLKKILDDYQIPFEEEALKYISQVADGSMRDAESLLDQSIIYCQDKIILEKLKEILGTISEDKFLEFIQIIINEKSDKMYQFIDNLYLEGEDIGFFISELIRQFRYLLLAKNNIPNLEEINEEYYQKLIKLSESFTEYQIHRLIELLLTLFKELKYTEKERFILENYFFQALDYKNFINLPEMIKRLEEMKEYILKGKELKTEEKKIKESIFDNIKKETSQNTMLNNGNTIDKDETPTELEETKPDDLTPDQIWREFKAKVSTRSPKLAAIFNNIKKFDYNEKKILLEFLSPFEEAFIKNDRQLILKIKNYFDKFNTEVNEVITTVNKIDVSVIKNPVQYIKENFKGEEV